MTTLPCLSGCDDAPHTCASTLAPLDTRSSNRATSPSLAAAKISSFAPQSSVFLSDGENRNWGSRLGGTSMRGNRFRCSFFCGHPFSSLGAQGARPHKRLCWAELPILSPTVPLDGFQERHPLPTRNTARHPFGGLKHPRTKLVRNTFDSFCTRCFNDRSSPPLRVAH